MTGEIPTGEHSVFHFLDIFALGCGLEACASFFKGESRWKVAGEVGSAIAFHLIGTKWPRIKNKLWPTLAELLDRISKNRWVRFGTLAIVLGYFTVSGGIHFYKKWFARTTSTQAMSTSELPRGSPPTLVRPIITWTDPEPITFGSRLSSAQLNANVNVDATPSYNHALGEVLPVGRYDLTVIFTPTDGTKYSKATQTVHLAVKKTHVAQPHAAVPNEGSAPAPPQSVPAAPIRPENSPTPVPIPPPYSISADSLF
jgi:hypothetical protein